MMMRTAHDPALRPSAFPWPPVLLATALLGGWLLGRYAPLAWPGIDDTAGRASGAVLMAAAVLLFAWSALTLKRHKTTILPDRGADHLVTEGPFRVRRNPIYLAQVLFLIGLSVLTQNLWFLVVAAPLAVLLTWLAILPEERHLEARFGEAYRIYKAGTRRWI
jgi:protein-S-isoprenylcysteine O-methyltransferase Ste14